jgi:hypothetical protein
VLVGVSYGKLAVACRCGCVLGVKGGGESLEWSGLKVDWGRFG